MTLILEQLHDCERLSQKSSRNQISWSTKLAKILHNLPQWSSPLWQVWSLHCLKGISQHNFHASLIIITFLSSCIISPILRHYLEFLSESLWKSAWKGSEETVTVDLLSHLWSFYLKPGITEILTCCHCNVIKILFKEFQNEDKHNFRNGENMAENA
jgi:hypothetical protein